MNKQFTTLHYLIAMLKAYKINHIVASPGARNSAFNNFVQDDNDFICTSVIDERSAAYVGLGIAREDNSPVVLSCTGATASRNYLSALTEAYYSETPLIALTFYPYTNNKYNLAPQYVDRSISQNDIKTISVELPQIKDDEDRVRFLTLLNAALSTAKYKKMPVHINCPSSTNYAMTKELPKNIWITEYYRSNFARFKQYLVGKKFAIFIGQHNSFTSDEIDSINTFVKSWNIPVFCDNTSNYYGENKIMLSQYVNMQRYHGELELIIDIGNICGEYSHEILYKNTEVWRISKNGDFKCRNSKPVSKTFYCEENYFFTTMTNDENLPKLEFYNDVKAKLEQIIIPSLPLSNALICQSLAKYLPKKSTLHLSILNSLRNMNFFELDNSIETTCNVGGFGIDGPVSTLVGQSLANYNKKYFGLIGDLAFFYDMNAIGIRHIQDNLRIIVINNNLGVEFRVNPYMEDFLHDKINNLIAAAGHNKGGAKGWAESCGFKYMQANNKEEFLNQIDDFCNKKFDNPVLFEVFTTIQDEQQALKFMQNFNRNKIEETFIKGYKAIKRLIK